MLVKIYSIAAKGLHLLAHLVFVLVLNHPYQAIYVSFSNSVTTEAIKILL